MRPSRPSSFDPALIGVFFAAAAIRIAVAASLWNLPLVRTPKLDSFELLSWARRLSSGDWAWPLVAQHAPGYPLFLAGILAIGGGSLKAAAVIQALMGAGTAVVVGATARRLFGARAGLFAGLAYAFYGPAVYIDTAVLSEGLLLFLLALAMWALVASPLRVAHAVFAGTAFGAATLVRPTALVIAVFLILWLFVERRRSLAAACAVTALVVLSPALAKNWSTSGTLAIQGYGGLNAYIGNSPSHDGRATFRLGAGWDALNSEAALAGIRDPAAQDRYYVAKVWREITAQPGAFARLLVVKALWLVQSEESRDSHSFYFFTDQSPLLRLLPRWWLLFPLAVLGMGLGLGLVPGTVPGTDPGTDPGTKAGTVPGTKPGTRSAPLLYLAAASATIVFLVVGFRYRMPVALGLVLFAGAGLDRAATLYSARSTRALAAGAALFASALAVSLMLHDPRNTNLAEEWAFTGSALITEHRLDDADATYRRALELDPQSGLAWDGMGLTRLNENRLADARAAFERAIALDRDSSRAVYHLAIVDEREGKLAQAADGYERALALSPWDAEVTHDLAEARRSLATEQAMSGRIREARDAMQRVVELTPGNADAWVDLCLLSLDLDDVATAATSLQRARDLGANPQKLTFAADALARASQRADIKKR